FGILKRRFHVFDKAPEFPLAMQAKLVAALSALHNFIRHHNPEQDGSYDWAASEMRASTAGGGSDDDGEPEIAPQIIISATEAARAEQRRERIAVAMWEQYQQYLQANGEEAE
ncbi:hypothetical protein FB107DRAFT_194014, partial [Schizophyllum commune]